jgi:predicted RNA-binding protein with PUA-like domain
MAYYLAKTDPETYSIEQFEKDKTTVWDGVKNALAARAIQAMQPGDRVFIYHSMGQSAVMGLAEVTGKPYQDPKEPKSWVAPFRFLFRLDPPTTLAEIKAAGEFSEWLLIRQGRLSTMPAPDEFVTWMRARYPKKKI